MNLQQRGRDRAEARGQIAHGEREHQDRDGVVQPAEERKHDHRPEETEPDHQPRHRARIERDEFQRPRIAKRRALGDDRHQRHQQRRQAAAEESDADGIQDRAHIGRVGHDHLQMGEGPHLPHGHQRREETRHRPQRESCQRRQHAQRHIDRQQQRQRPAQPAHGEAARPRRLTLHRDETSDVGQQPALQPHQQGDEPQQRHRCRTDKAVVGRRGPYPFVVEERGQEMDAHRSAEDQRYRQQLQRDGEVEHGTVDQSRAHQRQRDRPQGAQRTRPRDARCVLQRWIGHARGIEAVEEGQRRLADRRHHGHAAHGVQVPRRLACGGLHAERQVAGRPVHDGKAERHYQLR